MLGDCGIVNHFFTSAVGRRDHGSTRALCLPRSFLHRVILPVAGLSIVDTASLTDLSPFITMSLKTITASVAQGRGSQGGYGRAAEAAMCGAASKDGKDHRDNHGNGEIG